MFAVLKKSALKFCRQIGCPWMGIALFVAVAGVIAAVPSGRAEDGAADKLGRQPTLLREGTRVLEQPVICRCSGERLLVSFAEDTPPMIALENLAAQRILKAVLDDAGDAQWIVGGQITEFHDRNYILLDRVIRQPNAK